LFNLEHISPDKPLEATAKSGQPFQPGCFTQSLFNADSHHGKVKIFAKGLIMTFWQSSIYL
jgi:hypothetical protein